MVINLRNAEIGSIVTATLDIDIDNEALSDRNAEFCGATRFEGWHTLVDENTFVISGTLSFKLNGICDSCGDRYERDFAVPYKATYCVTPEGDEYKFDGICADLSVSARDAVILELPTRMLCNDTCKGICVKCGCNLNSGNCNCDKNGDGETPFNVLKDLI